MLSASRTGTRDQPYRQGPPADWLSRYDTLPGIETRRYVNIVLHAACLGRKVGRGRGSYAQRLF